MNQTPRPVTYMVVASIALLAAMGVGTLCASFFMHSYADPAILTAIISVTSGLVGSLTTLLSSPRSQQTTDTVTVTTTHTKQEETTVPDPVTKKKK